MASMSYRKVADVDDGAGARPAPAGEDALTRANNATRARTRTLPALRAGGAAAASAEAAGGGAARAPRRPRHVVDVISDPN